MSSSQVGLRMLAPAKINLGLEVIRRRADGFHDINTVFVAVGLFDEIEMRARDDGRILLEIEGNRALEPGPENLCARAAAALRERIGRPDLGLEMKLIKRIPTGAGLGGGSSDAASTLLGAAVLWGSSDISPQVLHELGLALGSDVPFFLQGGVALGESRGEILSPLDLTLPFAVLLVNPGIHLPTPWAYRMVGRTGEREPSDLAALLAEGVRHPETLSAAIVNDFEPAIFAEYPLLGELKERLYAAGALFALMSGSGSTMFGLFRNTEEAEESVNQFKDHWSVVAPPFSGERSVQT